MLTIITPCSKVREWSIPFTDKDKTSNSNISPKWRLTQYPNKKGSNIWLKKVVYLFWDFLIWTWLSSMTTPQLWVRVNNAFSKSWKSTKRKRMAQVQVPEFIYIILNNMLRNVVFKLFTKYFIYLVAAQFITLFSRKKGNFMLVWKGQLILGKLVS